MRTVEETPLFYPLMFYMIHHSLSIFLSKFDMLIRSEAGDAMAATAAGELDDEEDRVSSSQT